MDNEEKVTVYKVYFPHPDYEYIVSEDIEGAMATMQDEIENIDCAPDETITFKVVRTTMPRTELQEIEADI